MLRQIQSPFLSKTLPAFLAVVLCFSVLGVQSIGLFHSVRHANQEQHFQANGVFEGIENGFSSDPKNSNLVCKLLDSLLLGASAVSKQIASNFSDSSQIVFVLAVVAVLVLPRLWSYQSQAPPQSNS